MSCSRCDRQTIDANRKDVWNVSQHSQRTQFGPSRAQIAVVGAATALSSAGTAYVLTMPGFSPHELVACVTSAALTGLLAMHTLGLAADRAVARDRIRRQEERARRDQRADELRSWRAATAGLLDAYLTGRAVDFGGEVVPDYVRARLADMSVEPASPGPYEPYEDRPPLAPPTYPEPESRAWLRDPEEAAVYAEPADRRVAVPVSLGRGWHGDETEVISRVRDEDPTEVISRS